MLHQLRWLLGATDTAPTITITPATVHSSVQPTDGTAPTAIHLAAQPHEIVEPYYGPSKSPDKPAPEKPAHAPEKPAPEKPVPEKPEKIAEKPAPEKPAPEKPAPEKPTLETPVSEKPAPEKPASEKVAEKSASEKSVDVKTKAVLEKLGPGVEPFVTRLVRDFLGGDNVEKVASEKSLKADEKLVAGRSILSDADVCKAIEEDARFRSRPEWVVEYGHLRVDYMKLYALCVLKRDKTIPLMEAAEKFRALDITKHLFKIGAPISIATAVLGVQSILTQPEFAKHDSDYVDRITGLRNQLEFIQRILNGAKSELMLWARHGLHSTQLQANKSWVWVVDKSSNSRVYDLYRYQVAEVSYHDWNLLSTTIRLAPQTPDKACFHRDNEAGFSTTFQVYGSDQKPEDIAVLPSPHNDDVERTLIREIFDTFPLTFVY